MRPGLKYAAQNNCLNLPLLVCVQQLALLLVFWLILARQLLAPGHDN